MIELHTLKPAKGSRQKSDRIGRGNASGHGTTAGKGTKGQRARSGGRNKLKLKGIKQMLLGFPKKRGFTSMHAHTETVTTTDLGKTFKVAAIVDIKALKKAALIKKSSPKAKIVAGEELKVALQIMDIGVTAGAKVIIEKAGGKIQVTEIKK
ncbi:50S ribosomal protein L15 [Patescibacteria group bacterium]|nr:50S ribosomal protein L15 [Patescibacteria group bacterium]